MHGHSQIIIVITYIHVLAESRFKIFTDDIGPSTAFDHQL